MSEPTRTSESAPQRINLTLWRRLGVPLALAAACLALVLLADYAARGLREAEARVVESYAESLSVLASARGTASELARLRVEHQQARGTVDQGERLRLEAGLAERRRALALELGGLAARTRSIRASQAAVASQDAVNSWHEAIQAASGGWDRLAEFERLADGAETQIARLAALTERYGDGARRNIEAAVAGWIRLVMAIAGAALALVLAVGWTLVRRSRRAGGAKSHATPPSSMPEGTAADRGHSPDRLGSALAASREGVIVTDAAGRIAYVNAAASILLGVGSEALRAGGSVPAILAGPHPDGLSDGEIEIRLADERWLRVGRSPVPGDGLLLVLGDVSERRLRDARAESTADSFRTALDSMSQGLCLYDASHRLVITNRRYEEIYGHEPGALPAGLTAAEVLELSMSAGNHPGSTLADLLGEASQILARSGEDAHFQEIAGGRIVQISVGPTREGGFVATYDDVTERWHAESRIAYMARHDGLTDLPNRLLLAERIEGAITLASRDMGFAVHCLDLDNFKQINDTLGHAVGDELLRAVAHRLAACLRETDTVARLGGDEFAIVQAGVGTAQDAAVLARHVIEVVSAPYELAEHSVTIGVSIGVALAPGDGMAADRLLKNADVALYKAKGDGRGVFRFFEAEMDAHLQSRRLLEIDLRAAVAAEAFELHYQPIYNLSQDRITGFEALLRWTHPTRGRVSPADFVPLAEEIGLIVPLGEWVLRKACAEASRWPEDLKIAVNVSPAQFRSAQLIRTVRDALAETGLAAQRLELEITETVLLANRGATVAILHMLRGLGVRISMDDFGTGYSSLSYLRSFPFDKMKIDQSFIRDLAAENGSGFIVKAVISLGTSLGMTMTAEGVETEAQLARLREERCDEVQGYLFSPPVPPSQIAGLLEKWNGAGASTRAA